MIEVTRLNGERLIVNAELIETVEATPDTVLTLTTGKRLIVREEPQEIARRVVAYRRSVLAALGQGPGEAAPGVPEAQAGRPSGEGGRAR